MKQQAYKSTCSYCGVGCGIVVKKDARGRLKVEGDPDHPVNRGMLCSKGMNLHYVVQDQSDRLLYPEMRWSRNHPLERANWDTVMDRAAAVFTSIIQKHGPDSVAFYVSGQCLTEEYYLVNKLVKGFIGTNNIDTNSRLCMSSAVAAYSKTFGEDAVPISYADIELADCFMIAGANPAWCHPILFRRLEQHKEQNPQVKIIVVDPRKTQTCSIADLHLQIKPGTDVVLYNAIGRRLIETNKADQFFINQHTEGFANYRRMVMDTPLRKAAEICGVELGDIKKAAKYIGDANAYISMWTMGLNQSVVGVDKNTALINLSVLTGQVGKPGAGPFSLTGQPNAMGGREVGGLATMLAAHRALNDPEQRQEVADFWGVPSISEKPGRTATEIFKGLADGQIKAVWIICTNPMVSLPNLNEVEAGLKNARFVVVQDISRRSDTLAYADLVLPAAAWLEKEGTMTNSERRISYLSKAIDAPGEALPDVEILLRFAHKMGYHGFDYRHISEVYDEHCRLTKNTNIDISGLSHERLQREGTFQWPVPASDHPGTPRLFSDFRFFTKNNKARFNLPQQMYNTSEKPNADYPLVLTTGRIRDQWHTMTKTGKVNRLLTHINAPFLEIHPQDAAARGLTDGDTAVVKNGRGEVQVSVKISEDIRPGVVFLPMHWGKILDSPLGRCNNLTSDLVDPVSKEPDFKYSTVQVGPYVKPFQKILVIGAGAAAYRFVQSFREKNQKDEIHVFSREPDAFYNRVLLPEYVSEHLAWEQLLKMREGEVERLGIRLHLGLGIEKIDPLLKTVTDTNGQIHGYDVLIMATGSRPIVPREVPLSLPGVFTMRSRQDADRLKDYLEESGLPREDQHVAIVGGGLLGLELAAALRNIDVKITLIQRAARLMERQLDTIGSRLLAEDVMERDIQIYFDNEVHTITSASGTSATLGDRSTGVVVNLKSGRTIQCTAIVYAIGTIPNIDLAKNAAIRCGKGVVVNDYLQTSDPHVFAMGEIAEFKGALYGITAAAEQQADVLANYLNGNISSRYNGSVLMNILKFEDLHLCSIGDIYFPEDDLDYEQIVFTDLSRRYYKKCIVYKDRLVGAILIGDKTEFAEYKGLIEDKIELSEKRVELLRGKSQGSPVEGKLVCSCNQVGEGNLNAAIQNGCHDFRTLCKSTGAGMGCGSCKPEVKALLDQTLNKVDHAAELATHPGQRGSALAQ
ncbi:MAG TPA: molybdopterin-dependent oxidoreductase [Haliscomenobacter sp.]|uniref:molybdopterin-dependent oxidoreductase n=1 Tax=Haliscomenobacter sp. TaxID=2717303 RepID=UPI002BD36BE2|nr:molybdopterin-dependent oxidoreductase [Haliscomenobacter sp.]HOY19294.1 molybdopterin-dependent oxidoreductase [Haliscomenobacter sp.]HPH17541.1 molybdopterin-dependent oxidoreductase [Haliscomenobacter sp.]